MTKKHFEAIANNFDKEITLARATGDLSAQFSLKCLALSMAATFAEFNPRFDREVFIRACGI